MKYTEYIIPIGEEAKEFDEIFIGVLRKHKELIRCKECKYYGTDWTGMNCDVFCCSMPKEGFCSMGERKEE